MTTHEAVIHLTIKLDSKVANADHAAENIAHNLANQFVWNDYGEHVIEVSGQVVGPVTRKQPRKRSG